MQPMIINTPINNQLQQQMLLNQSSKTIQIRIDNIPPNKNWKEVRYLIGGIIHHSNILQVKLLPPLTSIVPPFLTFHSCLITLKNKLGWDQINRLIAILNNYQWDFYQLYAYNFSLYDFQLPPNASPYHMNMLPTNNMSLTLPVQIPSTLPPPHSTSTATHATSLSPKLINSSLNSKSNSISNSNNNVNSNNSPPNNYQLSHSRSRSQGSMGNTTTTNTTNSSTINTSDYYTTATNNNNNNNSNINNVGKQNSLTNGYPRPYPSSYETTRTNSNKSSNPNSRHSSISTSQISSNQSPSRHIHAQQQQQNATFANSSTLNNGIQMHSSQVPPPPPVIPYNNFINQQPIYPEFYFSTNGTAINHNSNTQMIQHIARLNNPNNMSRSSHTYNNKNGTITGSRYYMNSTNNNLNNGLVINGSNKKANSSNNISNRNNKMQLNEILENEQKKLQPMTEYEIKAKIEANKRRLRQIFNEKNFRKQMTHRNMFQLMLENFPPLLLLDSMTDDLNSLKSKLDKNYYNNSTKVASNVVETNGKQIKGTNTTTTITYFDSSPSQDKTNNKYQLKDTSKEDIEVLRVENPNKFQSKLRWTILKDFIKLKCPTLLDSTYLPRNRNNTINNTNSHENDGNDANITSSTEKEINGKEDDKSSMTETLEANNDNLTSTTSQSNVITNSTSNISNNVVSSGSKETLNLQNVNKIPSLNNCNHVDVNSDVTTTANNTNNNNENERILREIEEFYVGVYEQEEKIVKLIYPKSSMENYPEINAMKSFQNDFNQKNNNDDNDEKNMAEDENMYDEKYILTVTYKAIIGFHDKELKELALKSLDDQEYSLGFKLKVHDLAPWVENPNLKGSQDGCNNNDLDTIFRITNSEIKEVENTLNNNDDNSHTINTAINNDNIANTPNVSKDTNMLAPTNLDSKA
ncbi:hypothetical protein TBLA_0C04640 [Henningerozyma blattae CBS 6284]|uniref:Uncharacterized protein n=1 Tax=Henningerozyma blattae (strain ATCC 34711 / CBS 6284 / DSM 70876 / NBRC 10599 / NRRL Y-10934 / UCD 77-7) TaxID=1071380 RepID=I2H1K8_HENB6|nr:hypothetical protein TBLA_0C04640 [Tetrapisispora blattae CBS 6284]CCH60260.1 hypothetical protein TBLA_0C04640 [Tetrapisispora blattae CBS 6284]